MSKSTKQGGSTLSVVTILGILAVVGVFALTQRTPDTSSATPRPTASDEASEASVQVRWWRSAITPEEERRWLHVSYFVNDVARPVPSPLTPVDRESDVKWNIWTTPVVPYHHGDKLKVRIAVDDAADLSVEVQAMVLIRGKRVPCNGNGSVRHRGNNIAWCFFQG